MLNENQLKQMLDEMLPSDRHYPTPREDVLVRKVRSDYEEMRDHMSDDMVFIGDIFEDKVVEWLKENEPEFLVLALDDPEILAGSEEFNKALASLGYTKAWDQVDPETLDRENYRRWQDWDRARDDAARHPH